MVTSLDTWRAGETKQAIVDFVARAAEVPPAARVAVFDNDGTLWCEKPMPIQLDFTVRRLAVLAKHDPELAKQQPYRAAYDGDLRWLGAAMVKHYNGDDADLHLLMKAVTEAFDTVTVDEYDERVREFFADATHPTLGMPYRGTVYEPMRELLRYLQAHDFTCYIASGGDRDFMRPVAEDLYGVPPERVIGSALGLTYTNDGGKNALLYQATMDFFDDGDEKPVRIWSRIGRRPILSVGNSNGDIPMLEFSELSGAPALRVLIQHDDADREFEYVAGAEDALDRAAHNDWTVVSMKRDWATMFSEGS